MPTVLQLTDVSIVRGGTPVVDKLTWTVDSDERWVVLGPNGAGKTSLLQVAAAQSQNHTNKINYTIINFYR